MSGGRCELGITNTNSPGLDEADPQPQYDGRQLLISPRVAGRERVRPVDERRPEHVGQVAAVAVPRRTGRRRRLGRAVAERVQVRPDRARRSPRRSPDRVPDGSPDRDRSPYLCPDLIPDRSSNQSSDQRPGPDLSPVRVAVRIGVWIAVRAISDRSPRVYFRIPYRIGVRGGLFPDRSAG